MEPILYLQVSWIQEEEAKLIYYAHPLISVKTFTYQRAGDTFFSLPARLKLSASCVYYGSLSLSHTLSFV